MALTRRQFAAGLGAGLMMLPLTRRKASAASGRAPIRMVFMTSVGMAYSSWAPLSSPGQAVKLNAGNQNLSGVLGDIMLIGGLPMPYTDENHGTSQHTTGLDFGNSYKGSSLETFVANYLYPNATYPALLLGASAKDGSSFRKPNQTLQTIDSPLDAFNLAFPNGALIRDATAGYTAPRATIAALVQRQIAALSGKVGPVEQQKLATYSENLLKITPTTTGSPTSATTGGTAGTTGTTGTGGATTGATSGTTTGGTVNACTPAAPNMAGVNPTNTASTAAVGQLQMQLIPSLLGCDVTRVVGLQWGQTAMQVITNPVNGNDEHANWHSNAVDAANYQENYLCTCFANMITTLKQTPDPLVSGSSLLDNTLVLWLRDIGDAPSHGQAQVPVVMAGATGYLKYNGAGGTYYNPGGTVLNVLLSALEAMQVPFGTFGAPNGNQTGSALSAIKL